MIRILGFSEQEHANKSLRIFLKNINLKSQDKKQKLKILLDKKAKNTLGKDREKEKYSEVRYMPSGFLSPAAIDILQDYVYLFLWEEKPYLFIIKNKNIALSFQSYFDALWKTAR